MDLVFIDWVYLRDHFWEVEVMDEVLISQVRHLYEVEKLSVRQISQRLGIGRKRLSRIIRGGVLMQRLRQRILKPYERLIEVWYEEFPQLKATQVYQRLRGYGFSGCYETVCIGTRRFRVRKRESYHELDFLPGECAQIDWLEVRFPWGVAYGFGMILAYSRYLYVRFYPRQSLEFFLEGHIEAFREIGGVAHQNWYDNLKSVVIKRSPELKLNAQFLDFARHFGFSIHLCNPYRANEKGRIERALRDLRDWLRINRFENLKELNQKTSLWRIERNKRIHRATQKAPVEALKEERLKALPAIGYKPYRFVPASIGKTAFVEFETNRYSVPSIYSEMPCEILAYPDHIDILVRGKKVASHQRCFERRQKIEDSSHRERLLAKTPNFKLQRIYELIRKMDRSVEEFLRGAETEGEDPIKLSYELFKILRGVSKATLFSALREAVGLKIYRIHYIQSLLRLPENQQDHPVYPQNQKLLEINYQRRELKDYDELI
jgi:transposase